MYGGTTRFAPIRERKNHLPWYALALVMTIVLAAGHWLNQGGF